MNDIGISLMTSTTADNLDDDFGCWAIIITWKENKTSKLQIYKTGIEK